MSSKQLVVLLVSLLTLLACAASEPFAKFAILQTTDLHGYILQNEESPGVLKLASVIRREYVPGRTLLVDCGDSFEGSFEAAATQGSIMLPVFNALPYDIWVPYPK